MEKLCFLTNWKTRKHEQKKEQEEGEKEEEEGEEEKKKKMKRHWIVSIDSHSVTQFVFIVYYFFISFPVHIVFLILNYSLLSSSKSLGRRRRRAAGQKSRRQGPAWVANNFFHGIQKNFRSVVTNFLMSL